MSAAMSAGYTLNWVIVGDILDDLTDEFARVGDDLARRSVVTWGHSMNLAESHAIGLRHRWISAPD